MSSPSPASASDRNLLVGVLALQMDFISRHALITALQAWPFPNHRPLSDLLLEQGALRPDTRDLLEALVQKHLELHDHDVPRSLATLSSLGPVRQQLAAIADPDVQASLGHVAAAGGEEDPYATHGS